MHCLRRYIPGGANPLYSNEWRARAAALRAQGASLREIGRQLGVSVKTVHNWIKPARTPTDSERDQPPSSGLAIGGETPIRPSRRRNTIVEVAIRAGVSVSSVSNFINDKGRMADATRERIREAMVDLRFTPNSLVRAIRQRRTGIIGLVTYGLYDLDESSGANPAPALISGINEVADEHEYNVLLYTGWPHRVRRTSGLDFLDGHIDGLLWISPRVDEPHLITVVESGLPTVGLLTAVMPPHAGYVAVDNLAGMKLLMSHLFDLGHRRIAYIGPNDGADFLERAEGYRTGFLSAGIEMDPRLYRLNSVMTSWISNGMSDYDDTLRRWLSIADRPTAIVAPTDSCAAWIIDFLAGKGLRVPDDISVTGFDNSRLSLERGITTVAQDFHQIGRIASDCLARLICGAPTDECRLRYPCSLVARSSTGPPRR
jgi:LacI family transcriptional regulator